jgi:putative SOS response-associated peptidase YedK
MSYDNLSSVSQNVLKFYQQLTGEGRRILFIFDDFHNDHQKKKTEVQHYFFSKNEHHIVCIVSGLHVS